MSEAWTDYDLHGLLGLRLIDPSPADVAAIHRQLGPLPETPLEREPDLRVRFVPRIETPRLRFVEAERSGFTDDGYFLLSGGGRPARARIPFESLDGGGEMVCERSRAFVPLLPELLRRSALRKGVVALHASAFEYRGTGILAAGWAHGGKTSALLAFIEQRAEFVGDEMVLLDGAGGRMVGTAPPIEVSDWQLRQLPSLGRRLRRAHRLMASGGAWLDRLDRALPGGAPAGRGPVRLLRAALPRLRRRLRVRLPAEVVCPGAGVRVAQPDVLFLMVPHPSREIRVEAADPDALVQRLTALAAFEDLSLRASYLGYRYAFPANEHDHPERARQREAALLRAAISGLDAYIVYHPRPVPLRELYEAMRPACEARSSVRPAGERRDAQRAAVG